MRPTRTGVRSASAIAAVVGLAMCAPPADAQTVRGRVVDEFRGQGIPTAAVTLQSPSGESVAQALSDRDGSFALSVPAEGEYYLRADALGYRTMRSPLVAIAVDRDYLVDLEMQPEPLGLAPIVVTSERLEEWVRLITGLNPNSILGTVMAGKLWQDLALPGRDMVEALRFANLPGATVHRDDDGLLCVQAGRVACLPIYVDGLLWQSAQLASLRMDEIEAVVYLRSSSGSTLFQHDGAFSQRDPRAGGRILIFRKGYRIP